MSNFNLIHSAVKEQTSDFRKYFIDETKKSAERQFDNIPSRIESLTAAVKDISTKIKSISSRYLTPYGGIKDMKLFNESMAEERPLRKEKNKYKSLIDTLQKQLSLGKDKFVSKCVNDAEFDFDSKVYVLSDKLCKKGFDYKDLTFSDISNDPKLFNVIITDGENKVHARSILAAEFSESITAHFRFIITNVK